MGGAYATADEDWKTPTVSKTASDPSFSIFQQSQYDGGQGGDSAIDIDGGIDGDGKDKGKGKRRQLPAQPTALRTWGSNPTLNATARATVVQRFPTSATPPNNKHPYSPVKKVARCASDNAIRQRVRDVYAEPAGSVDHAR